MPKPIGCRWVYKVKHNAYGTINHRLKAWLAAKDNTQTHGIDYDESFAPLAKMTTVRSYRDHNNKRVAVTPNGHEEHVPSGGA